MTYPPNSRLGDITVIGEALVDLVETRGQLQKLPGGSPMNVAVGLGRLGRSVALVAEIGDDELGGLIRDHLAHSNVSLSSPSSNSRTSFALARLDESGSAFYEFDLGWEIDQSVEVPASKLLHGGSIGSWLEPGATTVLRIAERWQL